MHHLLCCTRHCRAKWYGEMEWDVEGDHLLHRLKGVFEKGCCVVCLRESERNA